MALSTNNRVFYACQSAAIKANGGALTWTTGHVVFGAQSIGITTNINLTQLFQLGNIEIYENAELLPDVEVSLQKIMDGRCPAYLLATTAATSPTLVGRSASRCDIGLAIYPDTNNYASGTPLTVCANSGMYINSVSYSFGTDGAFTEDVSFVGNNKIWTQRPGTATGTPNYGEPDLGTMPTITWNAHMPASSEPTAIGGVSLSQEFIWDLPTGTLTADTNGAVNHADVSVVPSEIQGISISGTNQKTNGEKYDANINTITASVNLNRESIDQLGKRGPYFRNVSFPVEVSCEINTTSSEGDLISVTEQGIFGTGVGLCSSDRTNVRDRTIRLATCDGLRVYLGRKNKLANVTYGGGDAGGGNVTVTYQYSTFNDFTVMHISDVHASGSLWWAARNTNSFVVQ